MPTKITKSYRLKSQSAKWSNFNIATLRYNLNTHKLDYTGLGKHRMLKFYRLPTVFQMLLHVSKTVVFVGSNSNISSNLLSLCTISVIGLVQGKLSATRYWTSPSMRYKSSRTKKGKENELVVNTEGYVLIL